MKRFFVLAIIMATMLACSFSIVNDLIPTQTNSKSSPTQPSGTPQSLEVVQSSMDRIQEQVIALRRLDSTSKVERALLTPEELRQKVITEFFGDYTDEEQAADLRELALLGLLVPDFDLHQFYVDLYSEQVAGYYDPKTKEMYVISGESFNGPEKMTYAHEYTHVLQDQTWDMENGLNVNDENCRKDTEYCAGVNALIEGDASLTEGLWYWSDATEEDQQQLQDQLSAVYPVYESAPDYMKEDFLFPYDKGYAFVESLFENGDFTEIDKAYQNPPVTTEQILHPSSYPNDVPIHVLLPDLTTTLGSGWEESTRNVMGEWYTYLILAFGRDAHWRLDDAVAQRAAAGWGGDAYLVYWNPEKLQSAFMMRSTWDTMQDADEYWDALVDYCKLRWGKTSNNNVGFTQEWLEAEEGYITIRRNGNDILWLISPDKATAVGMIYAISDF
jgi:hypothetical protein